MEQRALNVRDDSYRPFGTERRPRVTPPRTPLERVLGLLSFVGTAVIVVMAVYYYAKLPDQIPSHFDAAGHITAYQGKGFLFFLPALAVAFLIGFSLLKRFPYAYNYPTRITPENAAWQYLQGRTLMGWIEAEGIWLFVFTEWSIIQSAQASADAFNFWIFWAFIAAILLTVLVYVIRLVRGPR